MQGHTGEGDDGGCGGTMKRHKFKIIGVVVVLLVAIILAITLSGGGSDPSPPVPPPGPKPGPEPTPPIPVNKGYNPYFVNDTSPETKTKNKVSGVLYFNQTFIDHPNITSGLGKNPFGPN